VKPNAIEKLNGLRVRFQKIYDAIGLEILGQWRSVKDPTENYYMTCYEDEEDYCNTIALLHENEAYQRLNAELNEIRIDFKATRLIPNT
jgi:hypothetical protein